MASVFARSRAVPLPPSFRLSAGAAFALQTSILVFLLAGSIAPTPLYAVYQAVWGFSPITSTVIFGVYAVAVLTALLTLGSVSDYVGRRPVLIAATLAQAVTMTIFASADGVSDLLLARIVQGLSTGAAFGALGAGLLDLNRARGTIANAVGPMTGTGVGALGSSLLIQYLPEPTHLVYLLLAAVFVLQALGVALMPETAVRKPGALASLKPRLGVPPAVRRPLLLAVPVLVALWALVGFYGALGPTLVRSVTGSTSFVPGGLALFAMAGSAAVTVLLLRDALPRRVMLLGTLALLAGVAVTLAAISRSSVVGLYLGTMLAGVGVGAGFQGALRTVIPLAAPHERTGVLSILYVVSYLAMGVPAVVGGLLVVYGGGVLEAGREYGAAVMVLAALALLGLLWPRRQRRPAPFSLASCPAEAS
jgi:MFS family permease